MAILTGDWALEICEYLDTLSMRCLEAIPAKGTLATLYDEQKNIMSGSGSAGNFRSDWVRKHFSEIGGPALFSPKQPNSSEMHNGVSGNETESDDNLPPKAIWFDKELLCPLSNGFGHKIRSELKSELLTKRGVSVVKSSTLRKFFNDPYSLLDIGELSLVNDSIFYTIREVETLVNDNKLKLIKEGYVEDKYPENIVAYPMKQTGNGHFRGLLVINNLTEAGIADVKMEKIISSHVDQVSKEIASLILRFCIDDKGTASCIKKKIYLIPFDFQEEILYYGKILDAPTPEQPEQMLGEILGQPEHTDAGMNFVKDLAINYLSLKADDLVFRQLSIWPTRMSFASLFCIIAGFASYVFLVKSNVSDLHYAIATYSLLGFGIELAFASHLFTWYLERRKNDSKTK